MDERKKARRDNLQNLLIALLAVTAVLLFAQSQLYSLGLSAGSRYLSRLTGTPDTPQSAAPSTVPSLVAPVRVAVTGAYDRYSNLCLTTDDPEFEPLGTLLGEALGSARSFLPSTEKAFLAALSQGFSIYYDFGSPLPLSVVAGFMGTSRSDDSIMARHILLSRQTGSEALLCLWDDRNTYLQTAVPISDAHLTEIIGQYEMGGASFALDGAVPGSEQLSPLTLIPSEPDAQSLPVLSAASSVGSTDRLLTALNFNPRTHLRYLEPNGTEVIIEGERSVRISAAGQVLYQSGGEDMLTLPGGEAPSPTLQEAVLGADALLNSLLPADSAGASLYLTAVRQQKELLLLQFDYHMDGVPIYFSDGSPAAEVQLRDSTVTQLSLRFRQYTASGQPSMLLPLPQAMAVASLREDTELTIGYEDRGSESVSAQWLSI